MITIIHMLDVVNLDPTNVASYTYIGRRNGTYGLARSPFYNPFTVEQYGREGACQKYRDDKLAPAMRQRQGMLYEAVERVAIATELGHLHPPSLLVHE